MTTGFRDQIQIGIRLIFIGKGHLIRAIGDVDKYGANSIVAHVGPSFYLDVKIQ